MPCLLFINSSIILIVFVFIYVYILEYSGCDIDSPRKPGPGGRGGEESKDLSSPLHLCCHWGLQNVVQTLLEHGANVNAWVSNISCGSFVLLNFNL